LYPFTLYTLCIISNHVHYLLESEAPGDLPRIMHWLDWYSAMCCNRRLNRTGHFWEQRYHSSGFAHHDHHHALNTLRYIHANPKAVGMSKGFHDRYSNDRTHGQLVDDGLTQWHPAFL
jgi:putative transposase